MINEEIRKVRIRVINCNTCNIVRSEELITGELISRIAYRFVTKECIVIASTDNSFYCFYINGEPYFCTVLIDIEIINFFEEVLTGLYDDARDSFHIKYGRVSTLCQRNGIVASSKYDELLTCIDNLWNVRYYSKFIKKEEKIDD